MKLILRWICIGRFSASSLFAQSPVTVTVNSRSHGYRLNLTVYGVGDEANLYVTIINKERGAAARNAVVMIAPLGFSPKSVEAMSLIVPGGNVEATTGITLGGASITNSGTWRGEWTVLGATTNFPFNVIVESASAVIMKLLKVENLETGSVKSDNKSFWPGSSSTSIETTRLPMAERAVRTVINVPRYFDLFIKLGFASAAAENLS